MKFVQIYLYSGDWVTGNRIESENDASYFDVKPLRSREIKGMITHMQSGFYVINGEVFFFVTLYQNLPNYIL